MKLEKIKFAFIVLILGILICSFTSDLLGQTFENKKFSFDTILANQIIYLSVWISILTMIWCTIKILDFFRKTTKNAWAESENVLTMIFTLQFISFFVFSINYITGGETVSLNRWFKIVKTVLEHWVVPIIFMFYYFLFRTTRKNDIKKYAIFKAPLNLIIPVLYILFVVIRRVILHETGKDTKSYVLYVFPYSIVDPYESLWFSIFALVMLILVTYIFSVLFEWLSIKSSTLVTDFLVRKKWIKS